MTNLREVKIFYANGDIINTSMAANLTDKEIKQYFKVGRNFNIGSVVGNLQAVKKAEILK